MINIILIYFEYIYIYILDKIIYKLLYIMISEVRPYIIITVGATGSGKTALIEKTIQHLNIQDQNYVKILVDDLVENDSKYKEKVLQIIEGVSERCERYNNTEKYEECIESEREKFINPSKILLDQFADAYYDVRNQKCCLQNAEFNCNELNDENLKVAFKNNKNIILETTGTYIPKWILSREWIPDIYIVVFSYSLVTLNNLIERNKLRAYNSIQEFKLDHSKPAPRLPDVSHKNFSDKIKLIYNILIELYSECIINNNKEKCGTKRIDRLLIFDNNTVSLINTYDSNNDSNKNLEDFKEKINCSFRLINNNSYSKKYLKYKSKYLKLKQNIIM